MKKKASEHSPKSLAKSATGIHGLDEITGGGLPAGRPTLLCGGPGCGKTLLAMEFLVHGAADYGEPGVFMAFEETAEELAENVASLGLRFEGPDRPQLLLIDYGPGRTQSRSRRTGEYDLKGLFIRLGDAIDTIKAKRVVLDTIEALFAGLSNQAMRAPSCFGSFAGSRRKASRSIMTGERGEGTLTRYGLEEYVSDCVILLDHRVSDQVLDPADARGQVSRRTPRHQRVSVPDRRRRHLGLAGHLGAA